MNAQELADRRRFDYSVLMEMVCPAFGCEAYRDGDHLDRRAHQITDGVDAAEASTFRFTFNIPTLIGPGRFTPRTEIGVSTAVTDYPRHEPRTWVISKDVPWSPHFKSGAPVCIGPEFWRPRGGHVTLGELAIHLARLLNWDEKGRGSGYVGWNPAAISYHQQQYGGVALNPRIVYPRLPGWIHGTSPSECEFSIVAAPQGTALAFERVR